MATFAPEIPPRSDFHVNVQEPVNNRVHDAPNPAIFLGFNLFALLSWPFKFQM